ncbi:putative protein kinase RLK-Pelle-SD-2b family [Helianthus annuus]|nr:putative protein kinase RLK-Pelle-SD-2b family [Helianthus annuus]KAJ0504967.1 putative protein kinase RLK-Pelle-SD-2b family [Helianthus annuus]
MMREPWNCYCSALFLILNCHSTTAQQRTEPPFDYPSANLSTTWVNTQSFRNNISFTDGSMVRPILLRGSFGPKFACGFYCNGTCTSYLFAVFIAQTNSGGQITQPSSGFPQVVWSANRDHPVSYGAVLNLTATGELVLQDADGSIVWNTNTTRKSVAGLNLTDDGNLALFDVNSSVVWQSFDYPTDCLLPGQTLSQGQQLIPSVSTTNWTAQKDMVSVDIETCKQACVNNCSCKAALFQYGSDSSSGDCYLPFELFTMMNVDPDVVHRNASAFIKVQNATSPPSTSTPQSSQSNLGVILTSTIGSVLFLLGVVGFLIYKIRKRRWDDQREEESIGEVPGMPNRFSYEELVTATENFNKKLGEGGFGAVFEGTLEDGSKIAVKCLEGLGQVNKSFLAEVQSIGSIHHVNLVTLRGFGAWKSKRFLVYEFMSNGSLDRWIYHGDREHVLEWECRKKIILDVAKGLAYLHEDCRQKIIHLDIKPQNILIDSDFNAKVSDFGLSKLIDRNQTQVMTTMRGTPGYLAPEWLSSVITEKVDVYSFGIVLLEMLCGRKKFDESQPEESWHLLDVLQNCWEQGTLQDMVDKYSEDMQTHSSEVVEMMELASWCLQGDFKKRPSMSMVVKVLEGVMKVESSLDYNFTDPRLHNTTVERDKDMTPLLASVLSGPR